MANLSFSGKITQISEPQTGTSAKGDWTKTIIVVEDDAQYPNSIPFEAFNKQEIVDTLSVGQNVEVLYNASATEYNGKWFGSFKLWKVENQEGATNAPAAQATPSTNTSRPGVSVGASKDDDLPF